MAAKFLSHAVQRGDVVPGRWAVTTFTVIERPQKLEPITKDPFIEGLPSGGAEDDTVRDTLACGPTSQGTAMRMISHVVRVT